MKLNRRSLLKGTATVGAATLGTDLVTWAKAWAVTDMRYNPESGAKLELLRWKRFVQYEEEFFIKLVDAFTAATGVPVTIQNESLYDVKPKAAVAANVNSGPDMFWGLYSLPFLFPDQTISGQLSRRQICRLAPSVVKYGELEDKYIVISVIYNANLINYRKSAIKEAGFSEVSMELDGFLELNKALKGIGKPAGMALGLASGDGNAWVHCALWAYGGSLVDENLDGKRLLKNN